MADAPADFTLKVLRQIRSEQAAFRELVEHRFGGLESDVLETKRTLRGTTYMMVASTGRLEDVDARVDRLAPT